MHQEGTLHQKWTSLVGPDWLRPFSERQHFASDLLMGPWWWFVSSWDPLWERNWTRLHQTETPGKLSPSLSPEGKTVSKNRGCFLDRRLKVNAGLSVKAWFPPCVWESACLFAIFLQGWISFDPTKTRKSAGHSDKQQCESTLIQSHFLR